MNSNAFCGIAVFRISFSLQYKSAGITDDGEMLSAAADISKSDLCKEGD